MHRPSSQVVVRRNVRSAVYFSIRGQHKRILQVTSPTPGGGRSTLAANLAFTMAQSGKRVLLLDADFRRPTQHSIFGLDNKIGLASVVDSVLLTFRIDRHAKPVAKRARELLADLGAPVIEMVVNGISQDSVHYNQYGDGYGYGGYGKYGSTTTKTDERRYLDDVPVESRA